MSTTAAEFDYQVAKQLQPELTEVRLRPQEPPSWRVPATLLLLTGVAILVHGYHLGAEDEAIYLPAIKRLLNPALYPWDSVFFAAQTRSTAFPYMVAGSVRLSHVPLNWSIFAWHTASLYLLLAGCWKLARRCFAAFIDQFGAVALITALLTLPVAGTSLYLADQYLQPRTLATAFLLFAIDAVFDKRLWAAAVWATIAVAIHPLMGVFGISYLVFLLWPRARYATGAGVVLPFLLPSAAWQHAIRDHDYFFLRNWQWYEWLGIIGPIVILWWFRRIARHLESETMTEMVSGLILFSSFWFVIALLVAVPARMALLAPWQPMRYLHLLYLLMVLFAGGILAHYVLTNKIWRWLLLFSVLCGGMFAEQHRLFANSRHIDWPGSPTSNQWVQAFRWIADNTPPDAYVAIDPNYMLRPGEDAYGFRALAERSQLADYSKDAGVVAIAPSLAPQWEAQIAEVDGWERFSSKDLRHIRGDWRVNWAVLELPQTAGLRCPYRNSAVAVCRVP